MKKHIMKRLTALVIAVVMGMALVACGGKEEAVEQGKSANGNAEGTSSEYVYVPTFTPMKSADENSWIGSTILRGDKLYYTLTSYDPESARTDSKIICMDVTDPSKEEAMVIPSFELEGYQASLNGFQMDAEDNLYVFYYVAPPYIEGEDYNYEDHTTYLVKYDSGMNKVYEQDLKDMFVDENNSYIQYVAVSKNGKVFASSNNVIYVIGPDGVPQKSISAQADWINGLVSTEDGRIFYTQYSNMGGGLEMIEIDTEKNAPGATFKNIPDMNAVIKSGSDKKLLVKGSSHLYEYDLETQESTPILSWLDSYVTSDYIRDFVMLEDGNILLYYEDWSKGSQEMVRLTKTKASELPEKEVIVFASFYEPSQAIDRAIVDFNKTSSKYKITYKSYYDNNAEWTETLYEDTLKLMNADLTGSNPPDIIDLTNVNIKNLANKNVLEDLSPYLEASDVLKKEDFVPSVLNAYTMNDKLVTIPRRFQLNTLLAKRSLVGDKPGWTLDDVIQLADKYPEAMLMQYVTPESALQMCLQYNSSSFVDYENGTCSFDSPEFIKVLEFANRFDEEVDYEGSYPTQIQENKILLGTLYVSDVQEYQMYHLMFEEPTVCIGYPTTDGSQGVFLSGSEMYGIISDSAHKEGAWEFLEKYLEYSSDDMYAWALSSRVDELEEMFQEDMKPEYERDEKGEYKKDENGELIEIPKTTWGYDDWEAKIYAATQEQVDDVKKLIEMAKPLNNNDEDIMKIVNEEAAPYFKGQKSAQDVAKIIQSRVSIFISENS